MVRIENNLELAEIMAWRQPEDKLSPEAMPVKFTGAYMCHSASMS